MKRLLSAIFIVAGIALVGLASTSGRADPRASPGLVSVTEVKGLIHDGVVSQIEASINDALRSGSVALVIQLDTPGGLLDSTLEIVKLVLNAPLPIFVYVHPPGAQAGSAGAIITMAGHIAAMAPGTNIGAATPVSLQGELPETAKKKIVEHTASYIETIAEQRHRNTEWARKAVVDAKSITSRQAAENGVVDFVAKDFDELLAQADQRVVEVSGKEVTLQTLGARPVHVQLDWKQRLKIFLASPAVAFVCLLLAVVGIYAEVNHPGLVVPGAVGVVSAILFLFSIQLLPFNLLGLVLILLGIICFVLEMKFTSYGLLTAGGLACFAGGALLLFDVPDEMFDPRTASAFRVPLSLVIPATATLGLFVAGVMVAVVRVQRARTLTAAEGMIGERGVLKETLEPGGQGQVFLRGEYWRAISDQQLEAGEQVVVAKCENLTVTVRKAE